MIGLENRAPTDVVDDAGNTVAHILATTGTEYADIAIQQLTNNRGVTVAENMFSTGKVDYLPDETMIGILTMKVKGQRGHNPYNDYALPFKMPYNKNGRIGYALANTLIYGSDITYGRVVAMNGYEFTEEEIASGKLLNAGHIAVNMVDKQGHIFDHPAVLKLAGTIGYAREDKEVASTQPLITVQDLQMLVELSTLTDDEVAARLNEPAVENAIAACIENNLRNVSVTSRILSHVFSGGKTGKQLCVDAYKKHGYSAGLYNAFMGGLLYPDDEELVNSLGMDYLARVAELTRSDMKDVKLLIKCAAETVESPTGLLNTPNNIAVFLQHVEDNALLDTAVIHESGFTVSHMKAMFDLPVTPECVTLADESGWAVAHVMATMGYPLYDIEMLMLKCHRGITVAECYNRYLVRKSSIYGNEWPIDTNALSVALKRLCEFEEFARPMAGSGHRSILYAWWETLYDYVGADPKWYPSVETTIRMAPLESLSDLLINQLKEIDSVEGRMRLLSLPQRPDGYPVGSCLRNKVRQVEETLGIAPEDFLRIPCPGKNILASYYGVCGSYIPSDEILTTVNERGQSVLYILALSHASLLDFHVDDEMLRLTDKDGNTVAHAMAFGYKFTNDKELLTMVDGKGSTVAAVQAARGWGTPDPDIYRLVDGKGISVLEHMARYQWYRSTLPRHPMSFGSINR